jgi:hypothetical protein
MLAIAFGFGLGAAFGAAEDVLKAHLTDEANAVLQSAYDGDAAAAAKVTAKSWTYFKRAHLHANALGTAALAASLLLALLGEPGRLERASGLLFGAGALAYALFWLLAGLRAPGLGSTGAAKDALAWLAIPGSGACLLGLAGTAVCFMKQAFRPRAEDS